MMRETLKKMSVIILAFCLCLIMCAGCSQKNSSEQQNVQSAEKTDANKDAKEGIQHSEQSEGSAWVLEVNKSADGGLVLLLDDNLDQGKMSNEMSLSDLGVDENTQITKNGQKASMEDICENSYIAFDYVGVAESYPAQIYGCTRIELQPKQFEDAVYAQWSRQINNGRVTAVNENQNGGINVTVEFYQNGKLFEAELYHLDETTQIIKDGEKTSIEALQENQRIVFDYVGMWEWEPNQHVYGCTTILIKAENAETEREQLSRTNHAKEKGQILEIKKNSDGGLDLLLEIEREDAHLDADIMDLAFLHVDDAMQITKGSGQASIEELHPEEYIIFDYRNLLDCYPCIVDGCTNIQIEETADGEHKNTMQTIDAVFSGAKENPCGGYDLTVYLKMGQRQVMAELVHVNESVQIIKNGQKASLEELECSDEITLDYAGIYRKYPASVYGCTSIQIK